MRLIKAIPVASKKFCCNQVMFHLAREELISLTTASLEDQVSEITRYKRNMISKRSKRKRSEDRYQNDMTICDDSGIYYDLHVKDHKLNDCPTYGDPRVIEGHGSPKKTRV